MWSAHGNARSPVARRPRWTGVDAPPRDRTMTPTRLAIVTSHPIQYNAPLFRALAQHADVQVYFAHRQSADQQGAAGYGVAFEWDVDLLDGYPSAFLENRARAPGIDRFSGCDTPGIASLLSRHRFDACLVTGGICEPTGRRRGPLAVLDSRCSCAGTLSSARRGRPRSAPSSDSSTPGCCAASTVAAMSGSGIASISRTTASARSACSLHRTAWTTCASERPQSRLARGASVSAHPGARRLAIWCCSTSDGWSNSSGRPTSCGRPRPQRPGAARPCGLRRRWSAGRGAETRGGGGQRPGPFRRIQEPVRAALLLRRGRSAGARQRERDVGARRERGDGMRLACCGIRRGGVRPGPYRAGANGRPVSGRRRARAGGGPAPSRAGARYPGARGGASCEAGGLLPEAAAHGVLAAVSELCA